MIVLLNPAAGGGSALARWQTIAPALRTRLGPFRVQVTRGDPGIRERIADLLEAGERRFIAAGGDGTVNLVLNGLLEGAAPGTLPGVTLGAIALGSSNDFHKPTGVHDLPARTAHRTNFAAPVAHDVAVVRYEAPDGRRHQRYWLLSASAGVTAEGNRRYSDPGPLLRRLKSVAPGLAMGCAALGAVLGHRPRLMRLTLDDAPPLPVRVSNLGVVKYPNFTGGLRYDSPYEPASGALFVHLLEGVGLAGRCRALGDLARGRFAGGRGRHSWRVTRATIEAPDPFPLEADGEVAWVRSATFTVLPGALRVCP